MPSRSQNETTGLGDARMTIFILSVIVRYLILFLAIFLFFAFARGQVWTL